MKAAHSEMAFTSAAESFKGLAGYRDADELMAQCEENAEECRKNAIYDSAKAHMRSARVENMEAAIENFTSIPGWKDADEQIDICRQKIEEIKAKEEANRLERERIEAERRIAIKRAARRKSIITVAIVVIIAIILLFPTVYTKYISPKLKYDKAMSLIESGEYEAAYEMLDEIGKSDVIVSSKYERAVRCIDEGEYDAAYVLLDRLDYLDSEALLLDAKWLKKYESLKDSQIGDVVTYGVYQDSFGTWREDMDWIVLDRNEYRILLLSRYAIDCYPYNNTKGNISWDESSIRKWLNSSFINLAFKQEERNRICVTDINNVTEYSGRKKIDQCKIFVPAASDINDFGYLKANMICEATAYAVEQGVQKESSSKDGKIIRYCNWWLRDTNCESKALVVSFSGGITEEDVDTKHVGIRPAMWIKVE